MVMHYPGICLEVLRKIITDRGSNLLAPSRYKLEASQTESPFSFGIATSYSLTAVLRFPAVARGFSVLHSFQTGSGAHPVPWVQEAFSPGKSGLGVKLTTHLHLVSKSKMVELYLNPPPHVFMA
jgi:hypothetical protein